MVGSMAAAVIAASIAAVAAVVAAIIGSRAMKAASKSSRDTAAASRMVQDELKSIELQVNHLTALQGWYREQQRTTFEELFSAAQAAVKAWIDVYEVLTQRDSNLSAAEEAATPSWMGKSPEHYRSEARVYYNKAIDASDKMRDARQELETRIRAVEVIAPQRLCDNARQLKARLQPMVNNTQAERSNTYRELKDEMLPSLLTEIRATFGVDASGSELGRNPRISGSHSYQDGYGSA